MIFNVARFIGPAVAGLIIATVGVGPAFSFNALTFVIFLVVLIRLKLLRTEHQRRPHESVLSSISQGIRYALGHGGIGPLMVMLVGTACAGRSLPDLLPGFADGVFKRGATGLAWLTSMMGLGAMLSGFVFLARDGVAGMTSLVLHAVLALGISVMLFALVDTFWMANVFVFALGVTLNLSGIGVLNLMQNGVEGVMRGRVMSIYTFLHQGATELGTLALGAFAEYSSLAWPVAVAGAVTILVWVAMLPRLKGMRAALEIAPPHARQPKDDP
jgi:hypothetical protein